MSDIYQATYDAVRSRISGGNISEAFQEAIGQQVHYLALSIEAVRTEYGQAADTQRVAALETMRPSVIYRPAISIDGSQWCALYGENLQDGVAGFGDSPALAMADFDANWILPLEVKP
jgi:hypothetical protein